MNVNRPTIFALATPPGKSGLAVMRVSGTKAGVMLSALTRGKPCSERMATLCNLYEKNIDKPFDQALVLWFKGPASFTGEDVFELHLHGGPAIIEAASEALSSLGAEPAGPGAFTRRAFENAKLDLVQAEAVADLIDAQTRGQLEQAQRQLRGDLGALYGAWREDLTMIRAQVEACIDFPEEDDVMEDALAALGPKVSTLMTQIDAHLQDHHRGERVREGLRIALIGKVNAGKSTLMNRLAGEEAAIVSDEPGTTRDVVRMRLDLGGFLVELADTAGLRISDQSIEIEGIKRAKQAAKDADIRILVIDASASESIEDDVQSLLREGDVVVYNKSDISEAQAVPANDDFPVNVSVHILSAREGKGVDEFLKALEARVVSLLGAQESPSLTRARHRLALKDTKRALALCMDRLKDSPELAGEHLREAAAALGQITGEAGTEEVLGKIFSAFCIGK
ncbi:MAG: tRNA uridine-5-carboxymethylaminomethyl(34) synthesis GTPase MnmE [Robiginitomaculum sp.]|nr:tRNA uridine-5-carboxymethylaminomethyl(34) synthesis GTPase MnmE [Robiginitomaculum sp.]MDQ7078912.1 tRNA uridine-5-carboxymethylaminomethyl(34) synthesis GTPase MnmE [Robiginitomaculum sp.]